MPGQLVILLNGESQLHYDRNKQLLAHQREFLDKMDSELKRGISIDDQLIERPDLQQRAQFVALNLIHALQTGEEQKAAAMCAYLAVFLPDLKQVNARQKAHGVLVDLVFDREYVNEVKVRFTPPSGKSN